MNSRLLDLIVKIKNDYVFTFGELDTLNFEHWLIKLDKKEYNDIFDCLQVNQDNEFLLIRYGLAEVQKGMWDDKDSIYRECRSVVIDLLEETLIIRPFKKFFNLNEVEENLIENVRKEMKTAGYIEYSNKLDGSMQNARWYQGKTFMCGSMALNAMSSWRLADGYSMLTRNHELMFKENSRKTFAFEYISLKDAHVVLYNRKQEGLYLIGVIDVDTGEEFSYKKVISVANQYDVLVVDLETTDLNTILEDMKKYKSSDKEGWVINIDEHKIKVKCDDYIMLHRLLDKMSSINVIIKNIADDKYDDMMSKVPDAYKNRVERIARVVFDYKINMERDISNALGRMSKNLTMREAMIWMNDLNKDIQGYTRRAYRDEEYNVLKTSNRYKKLSDMGITSDYSALFSDSKE